MELEQKKIEARKDEMWAKRQHKALKARTPSEVGRCYESRHYYGRHRLTKYRFTWNGNDLHKGGRILKENSREYLKWKQNDDLRNERNRNGESKQNTTSQHDDKAL